MIYSGLFKKSNHFVDISPSIVLSYPIPARSKGLHIFDQEKKKNRRVEWRGTLGHQEKRVHVSIVRFKNKDLQGYPMKKH